MTNTVQGTALTSGYRIIKNISENFAYFILFSIKKKRKGGRERKGKGKGTKKEWKERKERKGRKLKEGKEGK